MSTYAFIDSQNVNQEIKKLGWKLDWKKFRVYLKEKYKVNKAYLFLGYIPKNQKMYDFLEKAGFVLIFKEILQYKNGKIKGNVDAELVLQAMIDFDKYKQAVIITGDGDFACLVKYLLKKKKLKKLLVPNIRKFSRLLKKAAKGHLESLCVLKKKIQYLSKVKRTP